MKILVDADACPVVRIVEQVAEKENIRVILLCDTNHVLYSDYSEVKVIGAGADAVDFALVNLCEKGDIVVTQDYGVAAMALGKGAFGIHQSGKWYTNDNIDRMLMERHIHKKERRAKGKHHVKGPAKRTAEDDMRFEESFIKLVKKGMTEQSCTIKFEKADHSLIDELTQIRMDYLSEDYGNINENDSQKIIDSLPDYYKKHINQDLFAYVARTDKIVASAFLLVVEKPANPSFISGKTGMILNVYTKPEFRKQGIARYLIEMLLADAKKMNLDFVELKATQAGYELYKKIGFKDSVDKYMPMKYTILNGER